MSHQRSLFLQLNKGLLELELSVCIPNIKLVKLDLLVSPGHFSAAYVHMFVCLSAENIGRNGEQLHKARTFN